MRKLLATLLSLVCLPAFGVGIEIVRATMTVTNAPTTNGMAAIITHVGGTTTRTWTNNATGTPSISIATNLTIAGSATNLWDHFASSPVFSSYALDPKDSSLSSNSVTIVSSPGGGISIIATGFWARVTYATQTIATPLTFVVRVPVIVEASSNQTYIGSKLLSGINDLATNAFATNSVAMARFAAASNSILNGNWISNALAINGTTHRLTNGYYTNATLDLPITTNLVNRGNAISSPKTGYTSAEQFGTGATATNDYATAVGAAAAAGGIQSSAFGYLAQATGYIAVAIGSGAVANEYQSSAFGTGSGAAARNATAIGAYAAVPSSAHTNSTALGYNATTTEANQTMVGDGTMSLRVPGRVVANSITNAYLTGTNINSGDLSFVRFNNSSLANGNNAGVLIGTNHFMNGSGPTAAFALCGFQGGRDGKEFIFMKTNSLTCTIANESGVEPTAAQRILTGTGGDVTFTNNPGFARFIYLNDLQRWALQSKSN